MTPADACEQLAGLGIAVPVAAFEAELRRRGADLLAVNLVDLALAFACASGSGSAIIHFEREYFAQASRALKKLKLSNTLADDVLGWMRFELFARPKGPLITNYSGRGDLGSWVRAIAVHEALKRARRQRREVTDEVAAELPVTEPEFAAMRGAYGKQFTRALGESFAALTTEERNLLRQYFLDGLTIDVLAGLHKVHRATAARRVASARTKLVGRVRDQLLDELKLTPTGVDEVITLSNLEQSLGALLRNTRAQ